MGTSSEGYHDLGFLTQQMSQVFVLAGADGAIEEADVDLFVVHCFNIAVFEIHHARPEDDVYQIADGDQTPCPIRSW